MALAPALDDPIEPIPFALFQALEETSLEYSQHSIKNFHFHIPLKGLMY